MDHDQDHTEAQSFFKGKYDVDDERGKLKRPPSSYGSMKSDEEEDKDDDDDEEEEVAVLPEPAGPGVTGVQMNRPASPETLYTMTTQQTKPPGAMVIDTRSCDLDDLEEMEEEEELEEEWGDYLTNSPEPPEFVEPEDTTPDEDSQPGKLHPEMDLGHIFKSLQTVLQRLSWEDLIMFKRWFCSFKKDLTYEQVSEGDILDFVDKILELVGKDDALKSTISSLDYLHKKEEADELRTLCKRALMRYYLKQHLIRRHQVIREGVVRAGKQQLIDTVYQDPEISTCGYGGVYPCHEIRAQPPSPILIPSPDTFISLDNFFRLKKADDTYIRTMLTTGLPGIGKSVCVAKFAYDWAEERANKDIQFIFKLSFRNLWMVRNKHLPESGVMTARDIVGYFYPDCKDVMPYLEEEDCRFLIIMDSFDRYRAPLDWKAPVIKGNNSPAHPDVLIVNIIRGTVLRGARLWILGRRSAVSQIPSQFIDMVTEIQGYSDEMKDNFLRKRWRNNTEWPTKIVDQYKRIPMLQKISRHPFVCWMVTEVLERCFRDQEYGEHPPRLTPFYINILVVQINRMLEFYYDKRDYQPEWSKDDKNMVIKLGKMALKMLEKNVSLFYEEDLKEYGLKLTEVTVYSGLVTEIIAPAANGRRTFCFIDFSVQEFMAALYVFTMFRSENKNVLDSSTVSFPKIFTSKEQNKSIAGLIQCAIERTFNTPLGHYDLFLRLLCGLLNPDCHDAMLCGFLFRHHAPKVGGLEKVQQLLVEVIQRAPPDRVENLKECLREMIQKDE
ncbi:protein NLRC3-like [Pholidichthys leucotaenia]